MEQPPTPTPPPEQQQQPSKQAPSSSATPPPQSTAASATEVTPAASPAPPTTTAASLSISASAPMSTAAASSPALLSSSSSSSSNHSQPITASQPTQPTASQTNPLTRPPYNRPWQQQQPSPFSHYSLPPPLASHSSSNTVANSSSTTSLPVAPTPRGGMAIGVPAHHPGTPPTPPTPFSSLNPPSFGQPFSGLGRNMTEPGPASSSSQVRQSIGGMQGIGMMGSLGSNSSMRPQGLPTHQLRPVQLQQSLRPQSSPSTHSPSTQNFQGHGMLRVPSVGSPGSPSPSGTQSPQPLNQPWLTSGAPGKPPLPPTSLRPPLSSQSMPPRHIAQPHHHSISAASQQQQPSSTQQTQQPPNPASPQEQYGQQLPQSRIQQSLANQQQIAWAQGSGVQRPHAVVPYAPSQTVVPSRTATAEPEETCNRILRKRTIHELVAQIDPSRKFDPDIDDILIDAVDDFVESIATFGVNLTKHRKSTTFEAKDILIPLERHWNISLPGFSGDEIKTYKKPLTSDIHRERLALIKKSIQAAEVTNSKSSAGQTGGNPKSHLGKGLTGPV